MDAFEMTIQRISVVAIFNLVQGPFNQNHPLRIMSGLGSITYHRVGPEGEGWEGMAT